MSYILPVILLLEFINASFPSVVTHLTYSEADQLKYWIGLIILTHVLCYLPQLPFNTQSNPHNCFDSTLRFFPGSRAKSGTSVIMRAYVLQATEPQIPSPMLTLTLTTVLDLSFIQSYNFLCQSAMHETHIGTMSVHV